MVQPMTVPSVLTSPRHLPDRVCARNIPTPKPLVYPRTNAGLKTRSPAGFHPRLLSSPNRLPRRGDRGSRKACSPSAQRASPRIEAGWPGNGIVSTGARRLPTMRKTCRVLSI